MSKTYQQIKENIQLKVDQELFLKILNQDDVSEQYVMWLNDRAIMALMSLNLIKLKLELMKIT